MDTTMIALQRAITTQELNEEVGSGGRFACFTTEERETLTRALDREWIFQQAERGRASVRESKREAGHA
mgnify:FL=1